MPFDLRQQTRGAVCGLGAAALFGLSAPSAKLLLEDVSPVLLAGLLYLGAAAGLWLHAALVPRTREAGLRRADLPKLAIVVLAGGVAGPVLMLLGLQRVSGLTGSLLLNLEAPFTMLLAVVVFREHLGRSGVIAAVLILAGALVLKLEQGSFGVDALGVVSLAGACACWALDNNLTQRLSLRDPYAIVRIKALAAGTANTLLGLGLAGGKWPEARYVAAAMVLGSLSYGASIVLDAYALRSIGAAREAAYFATAPFVGALASLVLLDESLQARDVLAMATMAVGVAFLLRERHSHLHSHDALEHEHVHTHDDHHSHEHTEADPPGEPHSHNHRHAPLMHDHPHVSDVHHRHRHGG
ncbi:MAG TPA: EamA family transporter [Polyangiales bacterium]|nr:EamA family transporter [Polyangiales bacterium]